MFNRIMKDRISQHKQKVSESAQKLVNILDMEEVGTRSKKIRTEEDYQEINNQITSLNKEKK